MCNCHLCKKAKLVAQGHYGNSKEERKERLSAEGYDYILIQMIINLMIGMPKHCTKELIEQYENTCFAKLAIEKYNELKNNS